MHYLATGTRVKFAIVGKADTGTVYGPLRLDKDGITPLEYLVASDAKRPGHYTSCPEAVGAERGAVVHRSNLEVLRSDNEDSWATFPPNLAIVVTEEDRIDGVVFKRGRVGRPLYLCSPDKPRIRGRWEHSPGIDDSRDWEVPLDIVRFCLLDGKGGPRHFWPAFAPVSKYQFKTGDVATYFPDRPGLRIQEILGGVAVLCRGAILQVEALDGRRATVRVLGGCPTSTEGAKAVVETNHLHPFPHPWIRLGTSVEVVGEISFRRQPLKGKRGRVLVPTDSDGDVGVQFPENLGAGSLDGAGENGHCLYINVEALKASG